MRRFIFFIIFLAILGGGYAAYHFDLVHVIQQYLNKPKESNVYVTYEMEAIDQIKANYWDTVTDEQLVHLFQLSVDNAIGGTSAAVTDRAGLTALLKGAFEKQKSEEDKRKLAITILQTVLYNLPPVGRSGLLASQDVTNLNNEVKNVNPNSNLYGDLGLPAAASAAEVQEAYSAQAAALKASSSPEAAAKLKEIDHARDVLTDTENKARYDETKAEPTVFTKVLGSTLYVSVKQMSPATLEELRGKLKGASSTALSSLIIDLRDNIGGELNVGPEFAALFFGPNQFAFDVLHQGQHPVVWTPATGETDIARYKEVVVLANGMTQSTAEVLTAALKRRHIATVVGTATRGWGSIEGQYPLATKIDPATNYAMLLVIALTLREDGKPVEGQGVAPDISINDADWQKQLSDKLDSASLIAAVKKMVPLPPLR